MESNDDLVSDGMVTVAWVAQFTTLSRAELYKLMAAKELAFIQHGKRRLIPKKAVLQMLAGKLVAK